MIFLRLLETVMSTHKDERGILVWKKLDESTDTQINLVATYDAYDTGITYEMVFDDGNIAALHKLFVFDATLIFDIIKLVPTLCVDDKSVVAKYCAEFAQRKYEIVVVLPCKQCEGENEIMRQNKILLRQVATLTERITTMETQLNKLATKCEQLEKLAKQPDQIVANHMFIKSQWYSEPEEFYYWQPYVDFENINILDNIVMWYGFSTYDSIKNKKGINFPKYMSDIVLSIKNSINLICDYNNSSSIGWLLLYKILTQHTNYLRSYGQSANYLRSCGQSANDIIWSNILISVCETLKINNFDITILCDWKKKRITITECLIDWINGNYGVGYDENKEKAYLAKVVLDILSK